MNKDIEEHKIEGLREFYQVSSTAKTVFDWAASRTNDAAETNLDRIMQKTSVSRNDAVEFARRINELNCGAFVVGRKGARSRIRWAYSLKSLGKAAQGEADALMAVDPNMAEDVIDQQAPGGVDTFDTEATLTIPEAKKRLGLAFGVPPESIEIVVRG